MNYDMKYETDSPKILNLLAYEDEEGNKYLDEYTLFALTGRHPSNLYESKDGMMINISRERLINHGSGNVNKFVKENKPDFSDEYKKYTLDDMVLYKVTDSELMELIHIFESMNPNLRIKCEIEHLDRKPLSVELLNVIDNLKDNLDNQKNEKTDFNNNIKDNKEYDKYHENDNSLNDMLEDKKTNIDKRYTFNFQNDNKISEEMLESIESVKYIKSDDPEDERKDYMKSL